MVFGSSDFVVLNKKIGSIAEIAYFGGRSGIWESSGVCDACDVDEWMVSLDIAFALKSDQRKIGVGTEIVPKFIPCFIVCGRDSRESCVRDRVALEKWREGREEFERFF